MAAIPSSRSTIRARPVPERVGIFGAMRLGVALAIGVFDGVSVIDGVGLTDGVGVFVGEGPWSARASQSGSPGR